MSFRNMVEVPTGMVILISLVALSAAAQDKDKKEFTYTVGPRAVVSITNNYGPITVRPSPNRQVVVETVTHADAVRLVHEQHEDRVELRSMSTQKGSDLVDYTVLVPIDAFVSLRSSDGTIRAQGLRGDVILEAAGGSRQRRQWLSVVRRAGQQPGNGAHLHRVQCAAL